MADRHMDVATNSLIPGGVSIDTGALALSASHDVLVAWDSAAKQDDVVNALQRAIERITTLGLTLAS